MQGTPMVVVGGGLAGVVAALVAAREGARVTLLERSGTLGGRARTTDRDGFRLNLGPHGLATAGPGTRVLEELGIALPGRSPQPGRTRLLVDGKVVHPLARRQGGPGLRLVLALPRLARAGRSELGGSVGAWLRESFADDRVRAAAGAFTRLNTYADAFDEQAADVLSEQLASGLVRYLDGGWGDLVERLRAAAVASGGDVRSGSAARRVRTADDRATGVVLADGTELDASAVVVANGGPDDVVDLLEGRAAAEVGAWGRRAAPVRMACLDVALDARPEGPSLVIGTDEPLYLSVHSDRSDLAPADGAVVHVARFLPLEERAEGDTREQLEDLLSLALPDWRDHLVHARYLPDLVVTHDGCRVGPGGRRGRPGPALDSTAGLYVAGDWIGPDGYLAQAAVTSARAASHLALRHASTVGGGRP